MRAPALTIRRVVTGHDACGRAVVLRDEPAPNVRATSNGGSAAMLWCTDAMPAGIAIGTAVEDMGARATGTPPPVRGTRFSVIEIPPATDGLLHRTETLDYAIVLSGEIELGLDAESVTLYPGDVVVQRGTHHRWSNRGRVPARLAVVLIDAHPLGIGRPLGRGESTATRSESPARGA